MLSQKAECFFWYWPTRVVPAQRPLNGCRCCRCLAAVNQLQQTEPPSIAVVDLFPDGGPQGEIQEYAAVPDR